MRKLYFAFVFVLFTLAQIVVPGVNISFAQQKLQVPDTSKAKSPVKIIDTRPEKPAASEVGVNITPFKPGTKTSTTPAAPAKVSVFEDDKAISNVKVFPNPVADELNLAYRVNKDSNVTIKIMDVLGNEITTLLSQKVQVGERVETFNITSHLSSGFYFVRLIAGSDSIVKRISVL